MRPDICAVVGNEDRKIADQPHTMLVGVSLQRVPLRKKYPLAEFLLVNAAFVRFLCGGNRLSLMQRFALIPFDPRMAIVMILERHEDSKIIQPEGVFDFPSGERGGLIGGFMFAEAFVSEREDVVVILNNGAKIHALSRELWGGCEVVCCEPALI